MAEDGRTRELLRVRALPAEAAALRAEAKRRGVNLSRLVVDLAADAGLVEHRGSPRSTAEHRAADPRGAPQSNGPDLSARVEALEARVLALEARPARAAPATVPPRPAAAGAPLVGDDDDARPPSLARPQEHRPRRRDTDRPALLTASGRRIKRSSARAPVDRADLPAGFPATGAELVAWREATGLPRARFGEAIGQSGESLRQQEAKGDAPLSSGLALKLVAAVEAGDLPAPG
jgi:DNA-binding transcriptional regulator YiaG